MKRLTICPSDTELFPFPGPDYRSRAGPANQSSSAYMDEMQCVITCSSLPQGCRVILAGEVKHWQYGGLLYAQLKP